MFAAVQVPNPVEAFDDHGQQDQQPDDQDTVWLMVADVLHAVTVLAIIETTVFDFPAALGNAVKAQAAQLGDGEVGEPFSLNDGPIAFVLTVTQDADLGPVESFPGVKVIVIPDLDPVVAFLEGGLGRLTVKTSTHGSGQGRKVLLQAR